MFRPVRDLADIHRTAGDAPIDSFLSRTTAMQLRRVVHAQREGWTLEARVQRVADMIAGDAHRQGASPALLLITLKAAWATMPDVHDMHRQDARELLRRLVTACIHAYYANAPDDSGDAA